MPYGITKPQWIKHHLISLKYTCYFPFSRWVLHGVFEVKQVEMLLHYLLTHGFTLTYFLSCIFKQSICLLLYDIYDNTGQSQIQLGISPQLFPKTSSQGVCQPIIIMLSPCYGTIYSLNLFVSHENISWNILVFWNFDMFFHALITSYSIILPVATAHPQAQKSCKVWVYHPVLLLPLCCAEILQTPCWTKFCLLTMKWFFKLDLFDWGISLNISNRSEKWVWPILAQFWSIIVA